MRKLYYVLFISLFALITIETNAQIWTQIGSDIDGEAAEDESGYSVSLNSDGSIVAIVARENAETGAYAGHVRIYQNLSGIWTQIGSDIDAEAAGDRSCSVSLSSDGSIVAIGASGNDGNGDSRGHVRIYQNISGTWTQVGSDINGEANQDFSGSSVSLSSNGSVVAIGAYGNDETGSFAGHVRIYENLSGTWTKIGNDIDGEAAEDYSGKSVSLSSDGTIVAIDAYANDGNGDKSGHVRIYKNIAGTWTQVGSDIDGEAAGDFSGWSVSLNSDGSIVAIGARDNDGNGTSSGHVRVYQNIAGTWTQVGADIDGEAEYDNSGWSVSLSSDGSVVAIGAAGNDGSYNGAGHVRIYENQSGIWTQIGSDIDGEAESDWSGSAVSLSSDATVVAIGAYANDGVGNFAGHVRVYELLMPSITNQPINQSNICAGDDVNFSVTAENVDSYQWQRSLDNGSSWIDISNTSIYSGTETSTLTVSTVSGLNNYQFRCVVGFTTMIESDAATLSFETENPTISCAANQEREKNSSGTYTVAGTEFDPTATNDNCDIETIINDFNSTASLAGASIPAGTTTITWTVVDMAGNEAECSFDVTVEDATGINDLEKMGISIYPNPTNGMLKIDFAKNHVQKLKVSNITGRTVIEITDVKQNESIDLSRFVNGIYIISIETDKGNYSSKIIKE